MVLTKIGASLGGSADIINVVQTSHTFVSNDRGKAVRMNNNSGTPQYVLAIASATSTADAIGIIIHVTDANNFTMATSGRITVDYCVPNEVAGTVLFLSHATAGVLTSTEPSASGHVSKPMAVITIANSEMIMIQQRGEVITTGVQDAHTVASHSDTTATGAELETLTDGSTTSLHAHSGGGGATTREGGNTDGSGSYQTNGIEATTNSTSAVSLLGAASMSIAASSHLRVVYVGRKTSGHASATGVGISMNDTTLAEAIADSVYGFATSATNRAENGGAVLSFGTRITNYNAMAQGYVISKVSADGARSYDTEVSNMTKDNVMPIATLTDIDIRGISGNALVTLGVDEFNIHSFSRS